MTIYKPRGSFDGMAQALDWISWEWIETNHPALAGELEKAVSDGAQPADVRRFVMSHTGRYELALRVEQAARWLLGNSE